MEQNDEDISLQQLAATIWDRRGVVIVSALFFALLAIGVSLVMPIKFEASVVVTPVDDDSGAGRLGGAGAILAQLGNLTGVGGFNTGGSSKRSEAIATLQSAALTERFIADENLLPILFSDQWDAAAQKWKVPDDKIPTLWEAERRFRGMRTVVEDVKTNLVLLTVTWKDAKQAATWANELVQRTNQYMRTRQIDVSTRNLEYANAQLTKTSVVELQKVIYLVIESEIKKVMIANGSEEYAFHVIDPARVPELRSSPKRTLITAVGLFVGLMIGVMLSFVMPQRKSRL